ncbi:MAG: alpha/beta fold hydrolase [Leptolyngbyaceae cyanobacterium]
MFVPPGFGSKSVVTQLGTVVYYTASGFPWVTPESTVESVPSLVFLHGFGGGSSAYEWSKVYPAFASEYRILAPDLIGWGRSDHPVRNYQVDDYVNTLIEFLEQTSSAAVSVVASSLTAAITIRAAIARPDLFQSLILTTPTGLAEFGEDYSRTLIVQLVSTPGLDKVLYNFGVATPFGIRAFLEQRQFAHADRVFPEIVEAYLESATQPGAEYAALSFVRGDLCFDLSLYIEQLKTPTAIIWGRRSQFTTPEVGRRLAALNPQAVRAFIELDDVGLTPQLELPAITIGLIRRFLNELGRPHVI